jgi:hypothetical protein
MQTELFIAINFLIDTIFFFDILVNFRTTFLNEKTGDEVIKPSLIASNYLKTRFTIDFLSTVPFDLLGEVFAGGNVVVLKFFGLLKLIRVLRLGRIITFMNVRGNLKTVSFFYLIRKTLKLTKLIFFLVMYLHCVGCLWFIVAEGDKVTNPR